MAIELDEYVEKVFFRIGRGLPEATAGIYRSAIETTADAALQNLAAKVALGSEPQRALLQKAFSFSLSGGATSLTPASSLLISTVPLTGYVLLDGITEPLQWLPYRLDLDRPPSITDLYYYSLWNNQIIVRDWNGTIPSATALIVYGSFVPLMSEVPDELIDDDLIQIGIALAIGVANAAQK